MYLGVKGMLDVCRTSCAESFLSLTMDFNSGLCFMAKLLIECCGLWM